MIINSASRGPVLGSGLFYVGIQTHRNEHT